jgi:hypothetical protein
MAAYSVQRFYQLVVRDNPNVSRTTLIKSAKQDQPFRPQDTGFDFAFGLNAPLDPSIAYFTVRFIDQNVVNS